MRAKLKWLGSTAAEVKLRLISEPSDCCSWPDANLPHLGGAKTPGRTLENVVVTVQFGACPAHEMLLCDCHARLKDIE